MTLRSGSTEVIKFRQFHGSGNAWIRIMFFRSPHLRIRIIVLDPDTHPRRLYSWSESHNISYISTVVIVLLELCQLFNYVLIKFLLDLVPNRPDHLNSH